MGTDVLVLDPDLSTTVFLERRLVLEGYTVESVSSLEEGVAVARASCPWLVVTHADSAEGLVFCHEVKSDPSMSDAIVVVVSSEVPGEHMLKHWLDGGSRADLYVRRPLGNAFFGARLEKWLVARAETVGMSSELNSVRGGLGDERSMSFWEVSAELDHREVGITERELELELKESMLVQRESQVGYKVEQLRRDAENAENEALIVRMAEEVPAADSSVMDLRSELEEAGASARASRAEAEEARAGMEASAKTAEEAERTAGLAQKIALDAERATRDAKDEAERALVEAAQAEAEAEAMRAQLALSQSETDLIKSALEQGQALVDAARAEQSAAEAAHAVTKEVLAAAESEKTNLQRAVAEGKAALAEVQEHLAAAQSEIADTRAEVAGTQSELTGAKTDLAGTQEQLTTALSDLEQCNTELSGARTQLEAAAVESKARMAELAEAREAAVRSLDQTLAEFDDALVGGGAARWEPDEALAPLSVVASVGDETRVAVARGPEVEGLLAAVAAHEATLAQSRVTWSGLAGRVGRAVQTLLQTTQKFPDTARGLFPLLRELEAVLRDGGAIVAGHSEALKAERLAADALDKVLD